jgi:hypothetical protein
VVVYNSQCLCPKINENPPTASTALYMHTLTHSLSLSLSVMHARARTHTHTHTQTTWLSHKPAYFCKDETPSKNSVVGALMTKWQINMESVVNKCVKCYYTWSARPVYSHLSCFSPFETLYEPIIRKIMSKFIYVDL